MTPPAIEVERLWKAFRIYHERNSTLKQTVLRRGRVRFDPLWALRDVSFTVPSGSTFAIVGSNGSGKSTTLKVLAGILQPDSGSVRVRGRLAALLELGAGFHPELTGRENVYLNGSLLGLRRSDLERRFDDIVDFSGLHGFIDNPVKTYSSGMYARLGFAVAINVDPDVLLIDEVLAVGDEEFQARCYNRINQLRDSGKTVVIVSHGLALVRQLCDHAAWIDRGLLRSIGPVDDVVASYVDATNSTDASPVHRWQGEGHFTVHAVRVCSDSAGDGSVRSRAPFRIEVDWSSPGSDEPISLGLAVRRVDGFPLATTRSAPFVPPVGSMSEGTLVYGGTVLPLVPGSYEIDVTARDGSAQRMQGEWKRSVRFTVTADPALGAVAPGLVDLGGTWSGA